MTYLGDFSEDTTVHVPWHTFGADGASITRATNGTVSVYKDAGTTQTTAGIIDTEDFDSLTGIHWVTIDTSADAFYATGHDYTVVLSSATIDEKTVNAVLATFSIENRHLVAVSALATTTDLAALDDKVEALQTAVAALPEPPSAADVWAHGSRSLTDGVSVATGGITDASFAADALTAAAVGDDVVGAIQSGLATSASQTTINNNVVAVPDAVWAVDTRTVTGGSVGSVSGAVGSVTGNVGGNVTGSVGSVSGNVGGNVTGSVGSVTGNVGGNVVGSVASVTDKTGFRLSAQGIDDIWDEPITEANFNKTWTGLTARHVFANFQAWFRNKRTQTSTTRTLRNDADSGNLGTQTVSDSSGTLTIDEMA